MYKKNNKNQPDKKSKRFKMSIFAFVFFSISGGGFMIKGAISQFVSWEANTALLYLIASIVFAIPYIFVMLEFMSIKSIKNSESGYQAWLNAVIGKKYGFFGAFFYFFVNLFYFIDLIPNVISYFMYIILPETTAKDTLDTTWFKPIIGIVGIALFWLATFISAKGPKWMSKIATYSGLAGFCLTIIFIFAAFIALGIGPNNYKGTTGSLKFATKFDISWAKVASISWALQSMGGLEALAAYKNNIQGGIKGFRKGIIINVIIFSTIMLITSILAQSVLPTTISGDDIGLLNAIYISFQVIHFPPWWTHVIAAFMLITTFGGSLMIWTAAPVKMLIADAPKNIFGKKLSKITSEGTPVYGLIIQGLIVTFLLILNTLGQLNSSMNQLLVAIRNLDGGAATIPMLFIIVAYIKLKIQNNHAKFEREFHFMGKKAIWGLLSVIPMALIFSVATFAALLPDPATFTDDLTASIVQIIMGPLGILSGWLFCEYKWRKWRKINKNDHSLFNDINLAGN